MSKTNIEELENKKESLKIKYIETETACDLIEQILDLSLPVEMRIKYMEELYYRFGLDESIEIINRLSSMYQMSGTKLLEKYMYELGLNTCNIPITLKIIAAKSLCYFNPEQIIGYEVLNLLCKNIEESKDSEISTPIKIEIICLLMIHPSYKIQSKNYFCNIINNVTIECDYRYKIILSLENKDIPEKSFFIKESAFEFFNNNKNLILYRILAGQLILQKYKPDYNEIKIIEENLISFANDELLDYNVRADSADVVLKLSTTENKKKAKDIIMELGTVVKGNTQNIFENRQNVHNDNIEESVVEAIEFLSTIQTKKVSDEPNAPFITFEYVRKSIIDFVNENKPEKKSDRYKEFKGKKNCIKVSLNRISLDRVLYSKFNHTLVGILLKVWSYICSHESEKVIKNRLLEELIDMCGTCSSGFASRLVNVISGFGDFNLRISWKDQITANFIGRLNARVRDITSSELYSENCRIYEIKENDTNGLDTFQEKVLEEMTISPSNFSSRKNFCLFLKKNIMSIHKELYEEFKLYISEPDFQLYFRYAISSYETGDYI